MIIYLLVFSLLSFLISLIFVGILKTKFSQQLLDIPNERSAHKQPIPRGGGLGFILAFAITSSLYIVLINPTQIYLSLWLVIIPLAIIGMVDDVKGVSASLRYLIQLLVAGITIFNVGTINMPWLNNNGITGVIITIALTIMAITGVINFYNFMDGLDGLVAGCAIVELSFLAIYLHQPIIWLLVAALTGFFCWNWSPAKIFMGDVGSTVIGASIILLVISQPEHFWTGLVITLPLVTDAIYTLILRLWRRENIFQPHRSHLYQRLHQTGLSHRQVASCYIGVNLLIGIVLLSFQSVGVLISVLMTILGLILGEMYLKIQDSVSLKV